MKKKVVCFLIFILSFSLTACFSTVTEKGTEIQLYCETMVDAILAGDVDRGLGALTDGVNASEFAPVFAEMQDYLDGVTEYRLEQKGWYSSIKNGVSSYEATFEMTTNAGTFYVVGVTDNKTEINTLTWNILSMLIRAIFFALVFAILLSFLLSKTITTPVEKLTEQAASIAAYYSSAANQPRVPVDYTLVRRVKKPQGAKAGMVNYFEFKTALVEPELPKE